MTMAPFAAQGTAAQWFADSGTSDQEHITSKHVFVIRALPFFPLA